MWGFGVVVQIDPDVVEDHGKNPERKKLKLKEVYLTKLLSTKARGNVPRTKQNRYLLKQRTTFGSFQCEACVTRCCPVSLRWPFTHTWRTSSGPSGGWPRAKLPSPSSTSLTSWTLRQRTWRSPTQMSDTSGRPTGTDELPSVWLDSDEL